MAIKNFCLPVLCRKAHHARWDHSGGAGGAGGPPALALPPEAVTCFQSALWSQWWASVSAPTPLQRPPRKKKQDYRVSRVPDLQGDSRYRGAGSRLQKITFASPFPFWVWSRVGGVVVNFYTLDSKFFPTCRKMFAMGP